MCLFFSGLCINRNVINNKFYEILRTDGKFEDERFIKPRKIVPIYENATDLVWGKNKGCDFI